jgi:uncharacterized repeat protein (TIGR03803 family)
LLNVGGTLYGTTTEGGGTGCGGTGCGTVFAIGPSGSERIVHAFKGPPDDGAYPIGALTDIGGTLYGTTHDGGSHTCGSVHCGTVYSIGTNGKETVIYNFKGGKDGESPSGGMVRIGSLLYGTTYAGGGHTGCETGYTCGTLFSITVSGDEKVLHAFSGIGGDGGNPSGALIEISDRIYGTTEFGGLASCNKSKTADEGCGTVYSMTTGGGEKILHEFKGGFDGKLPTEGVIDVGGELYGTAYEGGAGSTCSGGCGVLYSLSIGGTETVLHTFAISAKDGLFPSGLILDSNELYGVTYGGGTKGCANTQGCGIAYSASTSGHVTILHDFGATSSDAELPNSRLIALGSKLYGVSNHGGGGSCKGPNDSKGCGTVFELTP